MKKKTIARIVVVVLLSPFWVPVCAVAAAIQAKGTKIKTFIALGISAAEWGFTGESDTFRDMFGG